LLLFSYYHRYYPTLLCLVTEAYKWLEQFIIEDCQIKIEIHSRGVFKQLFYRFIHCRQSFKNKESATFLDIIRLLYGLSDVTIEEYSAVQLYLVIQKGLRMTMLKKMIDGSKRAEAHKFIGDTP
jgi:hypothetical protein